MQKRALASQQPFFLTLRNREADAPVPILTSLARTHAKRGLPDSKLEHNCVKSVFKLFHVRDKVADGNGQTVKIAIGQPFVSMHGRRRNEPRRSGKLSL